MGPGRPWWHPGEANEAPVLLSTGVALTLVFAQSFHCTELLTAKLLTQAALGIRFPGHEFRNQHHLPCSFSDLLSILLPDPATLEVEEEGTLLSCMVAPRCRDVF